MVDGNVQYRHQVFNDSGFVLMYPNIGDQGELLQHYPPDPFSISSEQRFPLGTKLIQGERVWRYALNGAVALVPGYTCQTAASAGSEHDMDMVTAAADVGDYDITITPTSSVSMTKDQYKEGYLFTNDLAGEGQCLKIKSHPAITHNETGVITCYDPVTLALTASTLTGVRRNPYSGVVITPDTTLTGMIVGACDIPVTIAYYFWMQTGGDIAIHGIGTLVLGDAVSGITSSGTVDGCVGPVEAYTHPVIGFCRNVGVTTDKSLIFLTLDR